MQKNSKKIRVISRSVILFAMVVIVTTSYAFWVLPVKADEGSLWITSQNPGFHIVKESSTEPTPSLLGNVPCTKEIWDVWYRPSSSVDFSINKFEVCATVTSYGSIGNGYKWLYQGQWQNTDWRFFKPVNSHQAGFLSDWNQLAIPIPNSSRLILKSSLVNSAVVLFDDITDNLKNTVSTSSGFRDIYMHYPDQTPDFISHKTNGTSLSVNADSISISNNGKWMATSSWINESGSIKEILIRLNLETHEILSIDKRRLPLNNWYSNSAISDDGRYIAYAAGVNAYGDNSKLVIYDLKNCGAPDPNDNLKPVIGCEKAELSSHVPNLDRAHELKFNNDGTKLSFRYATDPNSQEFKRGVLSSPGAPNISLDYLSLGDSFSSGEGDTDNHYLPGTNGNGQAEFNIDTSKEKCHISNRSYPYLLADSMNLVGDDFKTVACSGGQAKDIVNNKSFYGGHFDQLFSLEPQDYLAATTDALLNFKPGRVPQVDFAEKYQPEVSTIGVGGNDIDFGGIIKACAMPTTCEHATPGPDRAALGGAISGQYFSLKNLYKKTLADAGEDKKLYAVGYPNFVDKDGGTTTDCSLNEATLNNEERTLITEGVKYMNQVIASAARDAGVGYIDVENSLAGHELCSGSFGGDAAVNGLAKGEEFEFGIGQESFHPNAYGHQLMANKIIADKGNLLNYEYCTTCATNVAPSVPSYFNTSPSVFYGFEQLSADNVVERGIQGAVDFSADFLQAGSNLVAELHSDPIVLGNFTVGEDGKVNANLTIPASVSAGYHTLHAYGKSMSGEDVDLYQVILVTGPIGDRDADGAEDAIDPCLFVPPANVDADGDGIDDACDGFIEPDNVDPIVIGNPTTQPNSNNWYNQNVTINWQATDSEPSSGEPTQPADTIASTEGEQIEYISGESCDVANNCATGKIKLNIDKTKPNTTNVHIDNNPKRGDQTATLFADVADSLSGVQKAEYFIGPDPGQGNGASMALADGVVSAQINADLPSGTYAYGVRSQDKAGNWSNVSLVELFVDSQAPNVTGTPDRQPNALGWYSANVIISWLAVDPSPSSGEPTQPQNTTASNQGYNLAHTSAQSCDPLGNCAVGSLALSIDKTNPTVSNLSMSGVIFNFPILGGLFLGNTTNINATVNDSLSGVQKAEYYFDNGNHVDMTVDGNQAAATASTSNLGVGSHTLNVRTQDKAGNWSTVATYQFYKLI